MIGWVSLSYTAFSRENLQKYEILSVYIPGILYEFQRYFFWETLSMSVFQMFLDFDWRFLHVRKVLLCYKRYYSYYAEKRKIRPKNPVGRKCSVVIIMSVFYLLETLGNTSKNGRRSDFTGPSDGFYPILWG